MATESLEQAHLETATLGGGCFWCLEDGKTCTVP
jgi:peptide methionine sulfoxide reductase MsrA